MIETEKRKCKCKCNWWCIVKKYKSCKNFNQRKHLLELENNDCEILKKRKTVQYEMLVFRIGMLCSRHPIHSEHSIYHRYHRYRRRGR